MEALYKGNKEPVHACVDGRPYGTPIYVSVDAEEGFDCRFGGEWGGLTPVCQRGPGKTYIEGPFFATDCPRLKSTEAVVRVDSAAEPVIVAL